MSLLSFLLFLDCVVCVSDVFFLTKKDKMFVYDIFEYLPESWVNKINDLAIEFKDSFAIQVEIFVVIVDVIDGASIGSFSEKVFEYLEVGGEKKKGLLITLEIEGTGNHNLNLLVGKGIKYRLFSFFYDEVKKTMNSYFEDGNWGDGIYVGLEKLRRGFRRNGPLTLVIGLAVGIPLGIGSIILVIAIVCCCCHYMEKTEIDELEKTLKKNPSKMIFSPLCGLCLEKFSDIHMKKINRYAEYLETNEIDPFSPDGFSPPRTCSSSSVYPSPSSPALALALAPTPTSPVAASVAAPATAPAATSASSEYPSVACSRGRADAPSSPYYVAPCLEGAVFTGDGQDAGMGMGMGMGMDTDVGVGADPDTCTGTPRRFAGGGEEWDWWDPDSGSDVEILRCGHQFHRVCVEKWVVKQNECPFCKIADPRVYAAQTAPTALTAPAAAAHTNLNTPRSAPMPMSKAFVSFLSSRRTEMAIE